MLNSLTIKNFGIIESAELSFLKGLNVLTGETGAGKSILIDALRCALGERFQSSFLRDQTDQCLVEAVFSLTTETCAGIPLLPDFPCEDNTLIIQRICSRDGKNKIKINGLTATSSQLKEIGDHLVDIHGPYDHQQLLAESMHLKILDALTSFGKTKTTYQQAYADYAALRTCLEELQTLAKTRERDIDLLTHQVKELEQVPLTEEHLETIRQEQLRIDNAEKLYSLMSQVLGALDNDENGLETMLARSSRPLDHLTSIDPACAPFLEQLNTLQENSRELMQNLRHYAEALSFDQDRAEEISRTADAYHDILRKFGPTLAEARVFFEQARTRLQLLSAFEQNEEDLREKISAAEKELSSLSAQITKTRIKTAVLLKKTIETELQELGFKSVVFEAHQEKTAFGPEGNDKFVFYISPNTGESLKPLAQIVSSGESARIMLAIKKALMKVDPVPVLIFDEIDAQIGGRLGTITGKKLQEIAAHRQVILITHLPQIAAFADQHFKIAKQVRSGRTLTEVSALDSDNRLVELAHMMSGEKTSAIVLEHAKDMLRQAGRKLP